MASMALLREAEHALLCQLEVYITWSGPESTANSSKPLPISRFIISN